MSPPAIRIKDLRVDYGTHLAVDGVDLTVAAGEVCGLVGPNGAGKTSTFRVAATLLQPTYGEVRLCGIDIAEQPSQARKLLGYMPDLAPVASDLNCQEFLELFAAAYGLRGTDRRIRVRDCLEMVRLAEKTSAMCKSLSRGMMQRLVLAKTLLHDPKVLLLDEPASGMDPVSRIELRQTLRHLAARGAAVLISSHILTELADMCSTVAIMREGRIIAHGAMEGMSQRITTPGREIRLAVLDRAPECARWLESAEGVVGVRLTEKDIRFTYLGDEAGQAALLARLLGAGFAVRSFEERTASIEDVVMQLSLHEGSSGSASAA
jgi:ABC-2 type transport system ATP-binding protein